MLRSAALQAAQVRERNVAADAMAVARLEEEGIRLLFVCRSRRACAKSACGRVWNTQPDGSQSDVEQAPGAASAKKSPFAMNGLFLFQTCSATLTASR